MTWPANWLEASVSTAATSERSGFVDFLTRHAIHAMAVVGPILVITGVLCWERIRVSWTRRAMVRQTAGTAGPAGAGLTRSAGFTRSGFTDSARSVDADLWVKALAVLWVAAAGIHTAIIGEHFEENVLLGSFFVLLAVAQLGYAALIVNGPSRMLLRAGLIGDLAVVLLWVYTRVVDIPFGIGAREPVGLADSLAVLLELLGAGVSVLILRFPAPPRRIRITRSLLLVAAGSAVAAGLLAVAGAS